ncbi:hypothetical protein K458DRAFT_443093 [Lentithecium fluviatile CBS 122367]|uniref:Uncharacterized protein n=1 Tax=Lentithecium fluviatile CBS 122367 TaxID=1168545 RepID=A0A6G1J0R7_9PLEO|nr:hypothetical protein K458DRAFT_443093 [Lentithecium fluviatile CBS 122367]
MPEINVESKDVYWARVSKYGFFTTQVLQTAFPIALAVMDRVERYVLHVDDKQVVAFLKSYTSSFNMIGIAGVIIAQVAISAISLTGIEECHWTVDAFFITSLVTGCLSVFLSTIIGPAFYGLHSAEDIKDFPIKPTPSVQAQEFSTKVSEVEKLDYLVNGIGDHEIDQKVASAYAAIMLVLPFNVLGYSLGTFLMGMGIYLGQLYTERLVPSYGSGSIGILAFYLVSFLFGIGMYSVAEFLKSRESAPLVRWRRILVGRRIRMPGDQRGANSPNDEDNDNGSTRSIPVSGSFQQYTNGNEPLHNHANQNERQAEDTKYTTESESNPPATSAGASVRSTTNNPPVQDPANPDKPRAPESQASTNNSPASEQEPQNPPITSNAAALHQADARPAHPPKGVQDLLKELIRAQEESLCINPRLLEVLSTEKRG